LGRNKNVYHNISLQPKERIKTHIAYERAMPEDEEYRKGPYYGLLVERHNLAKPLVKGRSLLDTCCGVGWGTYLFSETAERVVGVDISHEAIDYARQRYRRENLTFSVMDSLNLGFKNNSFDIVCAFESVEHFPKANGMGCIKECSRVLKPTGVFLGSTPNCLQEKFADYFRSINPHHLYVYAEDNLRQLLRTFFTHVKIIRMDNIVSPYLFFIACKEQQVMDASLMALPERSLLSIVCNKLKGYHCHKLLSGRIYFNLHRFHRARFHFFLSVISNPFEKQGWYWFVLSLLGEGTVELLGQVKRRARR